MCVYEYKGFPGGKESAYNAGDTGSIPGWGRSSGEGNSNPLQYSCLPWKEKPGYSPCGLKRMGPDLMTK